MKILRPILSFLLVAYLPLLVILSLTSETDGGFITLPATLVFLLLLIFTAPLFVAAVELLLAVGRLLDKKPRSRGERIVNGVGTVLSLGCFALLFNAEDLLALSFVFAAAVGIVWVVSAIVFRKKPAADAPVKKPIFWIVTVLVLAIIAAALAIPSRTDKGQPDPLETEAIASGEAE